MPRGQNEAFKAQQGKGGCFAASAEKAREAGRKGGKAKTMTMHDFKRLANEIDAEINPKNESITKGETFLRNIQLEATKGNIKAAKLWMEIKQYGEPKNIDITRGGERLPDIIIRQCDGRGIATTEQDIEDD